MSLPRPSPVLLASPGYAGSNRWRQANREVLEHGLAALRHALALHALVLRGERAAEPLAAYRHEVVSDEELSRLLAPGAAGPASARRRALERSLREDPRAAEIDRARREEERAEAEKAAAMAAGGAPAPLFALAARTGLGTLERRALLAVAAPELDPSFSRLYAYANDDARCPWPTPDLLVQVLGTPGTGEARPLRPGDLREGSTLLRLALVRRAPVRGASLTAAGGPLVVDARILGFLEGEDGFDPGIAHLLRALPAGGGTPSAPAHDELARRLAGWLRQERAEASPETCAVELLGREGSGRRVVAALAAASLGVDLVQADLHRLPPGEEGRDLVVRVARECLLSSCAVFVDLGSRPAGSPAAEPAVDPAALGTLIAAGAGPVFAASREPRCRAALGVPVLSVPVPSLDAPARAALLRAALPATADSELGPAIREVSEQFELGPEGVARALADARNEAWLAGGESAPVGATALRRACRRLAGAALDGLAQRIDPTAGWGDIVLPGEVEERLREIAAQVRHRPVVYGDWRWSERLGRGRGIAALFTGPSGTGKTMAAEVLAGELDLDLFRIDLSSVISKYIGETEGNLRRVFDAAETGGAILFFDEADALFGRRTEVKDSHDRYANVEIDYLLQRMEDYRGLAILATNRKSALDRAFLRRLRFLVEFPFPNAAARRRIWRDAFPDAVPMGTLDTDALARLELSGGNIRNVALNASFLAAAGGEPVAMAHVARAVRAECAKCEKSLAQDELAALEGAEPATRRNA